MANPKYPNAKKISETLARQKGLSDAARAKKADSGGTVHTRGTAKRAGKQASKDADQKSKEW